MNYSTPIGVVRELSAALCVCVCGGGAALFFV